MATNAPPASPVTGDVLFYKTPEPLNLEKHGKLGLNPSMTPFAFASKAHAIPLIVSEFGPASLTFPIIFAGAEYQPLAITSIRANESLFVGENGNFGDGVYVPAFVRRYPFVLAHGGVQDDQLIVCIDTGADIVKENAEVPLFVDGQPSEFTKNCMEFCTNFETERRKTDEFVKMLRDLDVFDLREIRFTPRDANGVEGEPIKISEHFSPSEEKVRALPDDKLLQLAKSGALQQIHLHWNSLLNWERLINETLRRHPEPQAAKPEAANA